MSSAENLALEPSVEAVVTHLVSPLLLSPPALASLRACLSAKLSAIYAPTWNPSDPSRGSGYRSLIAVGGRLPRPLREAASECQVDGARWASLLSSDHGEWQVWCDPGRVCVREGGWEWEDGVFFLGGWKGECSLLCSIVSVFRPPRPSSFPRPSPPS